MNLRCQPLADRVLVEPAEVEEKTAGGIIIPDSAKEKPQEGKVIAVGNGRFENGVLIPMEVKTHDRVLYSKYVGTEVTLEGKKYLIMKEADIFAII